MKGISLGRRGRVRVSRKSLPRIAGGAKTEVPFLWHDPTTDRGRSRGRISPFFALDVGYIVGYEKRLRESFSLNPYYSWLPGTDSNRRQGG